MFCLRGNVSKVPSCCLARMAIRSLVTKVKRQAESEASLVDFSKAAPLLDSQILSKEDCAVFPNFCTKAEHDALVTELIGNGEDTAHIERRLQKFRRRKYQKDHWDSVIVSYKEVERALSLWSPDSRAVLERTQSFILDYLLQNVAAVSAANDPSQGDLPLQWLPPHIIDLADDGVIHPHVDSIKFSGEVVAGLSLLSGRTMRLREERDSLADYSDTMPCVDLELAPCSLYILCNGARFNMAHSIEQEQEPHRQRRLSIIFRDEKQDRTLKN